jgi:hypothetical protein
LSAQPGDIESWSGWQFQDPQDQSGFIQTFRTKTPDATHRFAAYGLDEQARYLFSDAYVGKSFEMTGSVAMKQGIDVTQTPMSSTVLIYRIISKPPSAASASSLADGRSPVVGGTLQKLLK